MAKIKAFERVEKRQKKTIESMGKGSKMIVEIAEKHNMELPFMDKKKIDSMSKSDKRKLFKGWLLQGYNSNGIIRLTGIYEHTLK